MMPEINSKEATSKLLVGTRIHFKNTNSIKLEHITSFLEIASRYSDCIVIAVQADHELSAEFLCSLRKLQAGKLSVKFDIIPVSP